MRIVVDIVGIQTINQLLKLGIIQYLTPDTCRVACVVGKLNRVDGINLGRWVNYVRVLLYIMYYFQSRMRL